MLAGGRALTRLGRATRNSRMEAMGEATQGVALIFLGRLSEGMPMVEDAVPKLLAAGQRQEVAEITMVLNGAHLAMGSLQRGRELSEQMLPIAESLNDPVIIACHCAVLGTTLYALGDWEAGRAYLRQADELLATVKPSSLAVRTITFRAPPLIWEGDWEKARCVLQTALQVASAAEVVPSQHQALTSLAELDLLEGDPRAAVARLAPLADADLGWSDAVPLLSTLAWAYLETGEVARAEHLAQRAVARAERLGTWFQGVSARRIQGMIAARLGRYDAAEVAYGEGLRRARAMPFPYGEAQLLHASGLLQRQRGNEALAREQLEEALRIFRRLGAGRDVERVQRGHPRGLTGWAGMSGVPDTYRPSELVSDPTAPSRARGMDRACLITREQQASARPSRCVKDGHVCIVMPTRAVRRMPGGISRCIRRAADLPR